MKLQKDIAMWEECDGWCMNCDGLWCSDTRMMARKNFEQIRTDFNNLTISNKERLVFNFGKWLDNRKSLNYHISLYHIRGQFVEVHYNMVTSSIDYIYMPTYRELDYVIEHVELIDIGY